MLIEWSEEDQAYLVTLPEWADRVMMPATHGSTYGATHELGPQCGPHPCLKRRQAWADLTEDTSHM